MRQNGKISLLSCARNAYQDGKKNVSEYDLIPHGELPTDVHRNRHDYLGRAPAGADARSAAAATAAAPEEPAAAAGPVTPRAAPADGAPRHSPEPVPAARDSRLHSLPLCAAVLEPNLHLDLAEPQVVRNLLVKTNDVL